MGEVAQPGSMTGSFLRPLHSRARATDPDARLPGDRLAQEIRP